MNSAIQPVPLEMSDDESRWADHLCQLYTDHGFPNMAFSLESPGVVLASGEFDEYEHSLDHPKVAEHVRAACLQMEISRLDKR